ncbi:hypothetical protein [Vallitalea guaymasensis]|uniref:hypothetical protein n=1 Tax=Vallitalea guaymasensis TaxID=1185412 RepID=UPI000DE3D2DB|nr:hypothetical protein [Vallitalea guaymasensis]
MSNLSTIAIYNKNYLGNKPGRSVFNIIKNMINAYSSTIDIDIRLPHNTFLRTLAICQYIESQLDETFDIADFIYILYTDFINSSIKQYNPKKLYKLVTQVYDYEDTITLTMGNVVYKYSRNNIHMTEMTIAMKKADVNNGTLLLAELHDLYNINVNFDKLLTNIWIKFIEEYKNGDCNKALRQIIRMLKNTSK